MLFKHHCNETGSEVPQGLCAMCGLSVGMSSCSGIEQNQLWGGLLTMGLAIPYLWGKITSITFMYKYIYIYVPTYISICQCVNGVFSRGKHIILQTAKNTKP